MQKIFNWIKTNKLTATLLLIVFYFLIKNFFPQFSNSIPTFKKTDLEVKNFDIGGGMGSPGEGAIYNQVAPAPEIRDRLIIKESYLSLVVKNVIDAQKQIIEITKSLGGYLVSSYIDQPEELPNATIILRIPKDKFDKTLDLFKEKAVKVVSENIQAEDITDQYVDLETRLKTLYQTKNKFEEILNKAEKIEDILNVQREIINLQQQIDDIKGQQNYYEKSAQMSKITVYLSTDEFSLPYGPSEKWRPEVVFKQAVRSLVMTLRKIVNILIWLVVYSLIWLPILIVFIFFRKKKKSN